MSEFEQQRRQLLLDEDFYHYYQKTLNWEISEYDKFMKSQDDSFTAPMAELQYQQLSLDYTVGKPIKDLNMLMGHIIQLTKSATDYVNRHYEEVYENTGMDLSVFNKTYATGILPNLLGLSILFNCKDWFKIIVEAIDPNPSASEKSIDSLIAMQISGYPITDAKTPRELSFRNPLYKAIHAETEKETLNHLDEYLRLWYDGLRKAGYEYIDIHLLQQGDSRDCCSFYGYWCFEAAAVAYLKNIDDSSLHRFMYYPKDMVAYARAQA